MIQQTKDPVLTEKKDKMSKKYKSNEFVQQSDLTVLPEGNPETSDIQCAEPTKSYDEIISEGYDMEQAIRDAGKQNRSCSWRDSQKSSVGNQQYYRAGKNIKG